MSIAPTAMPFTSSLKSCQTPLMPIPVLAGIVFRARFSSLLLLILLLLSPASSKAVVIHKSSSGKGSDSTMLPLPSPPSLLISMTLSFLALGPIPSSFMALFITRWALSFHLLAFSHPTQLYVLDPDSATNARSTRNSNLLPSTMSDLHAMLLQHNPYVEMYKQAHQILREKPEHEQHHVRLCITVDPNTDL